MAEGEKALTLWDFYETDKEYDGGFVIDDRPGFEDYDILKRLDDEARKRYLSYLPEDFVAGFDLSLLPKSDVAA